MKRHPVVTWQTHHQYQLDIFLLFIVGLVLFLFYYIVIEDLLEKSIHTWQWLFFIPWALFYITFLLRKRNSIPKAERVTTSHQHIVYWSMLGIILSIWYSSSLSIEKPISLSYLYGIWTLFIADSYWSFTNKQRR